MKKGFILIELLAVILILGIIALIAGGYKYHNSWFSDASG
jgi:prepilin-type N-terminal cleavage/methylation domain-containing protein